MNELRVALAPLAGTDYDLSAAAELARSLRTQLIFRGLKVIGQNELVTNQAEALEMVRRLEGETFDVLLILQASAADPRLAETLAGLPQPRFLWAAPETPQNGAMPANALAGLMASAHALAERGCSYQYVCAAPTHRPALARVRAEAAAANLQRRLPALKLGCLAGTGHDRKTDLLGVKVVALPEPQGELEKLIETGRSQRLAGFILPPQAVGGDPLQLEAAGLVFGASPEAALTHLALLELGNAPAQAVSIAGLDPSGESCVFWPVYPGQPAGPFSSGTATLARFSRFPGGLRLAYEVCKVSAPPPSHTGACAAVRFSQPAAQALHSLIQQGIEPDLALFPGDLRFELEAFARLCAIPTITLSKSPI